MLFRRDSRGNRAVKLEELETGGCRGTVVDAASGRGGLESSAKSGSDSFDTWTGPVEARDAI